MAPAGGDTSAKNAELTLQLGLWAKRDGTGRTFDSSGGFVLPNGATRSPDASWIHRDRLAALTAEERAKFLLLCPDFVIELRSPTDGLSTLQDKMGEYMENGAQLGWLIESLGRSGVRVPSRRAGRAPGRAGQRIRRPRAARIPPGAGRDPVARPRHSRPAASLQGRPQTVQAENLHGCAGALRASASCSRTALTFHSSTSGNQSRNCSTVAPLPRFSKSAETGTRVPANVQAPLSLPARRSIPRARVPIGHGVASSCVAGKGTWLERRARLQVSRACGSESREGAAMARQWPHNGAGTCVQPNRLVSCSQVQILMKPR